MSRGSSRRSDANGDAFPFLDEPEGRRRREKKKKGHKHEKSFDEVRSRRPRYDEDDDWGEDLDSSDWDSAGDIEDDLDLADNLDDEEWDEEGYDRDDDEYDDGDDWRSRDDR